MKAAFWIAWLVRELSCRAASPGEWTRQFQVNEGPRPAAPVFHSLTPQTADKATVTSHTGFCRAVLRPSNCLTGLCHLPAPDGGGVVVLFLRTHCCLVRRFPRSVSKLVCWELCWGLNQNWNVAVTFPVPLPNYQPRRWLPRPGWGKYTGKINPSVSLQNVELKHCSQFSVTPMHQSPVSIA